MARLRVAIVGAGQRADYLYCPLVRVLQDDLELVGLYGRRLEPAVALGGKHNVPAFDSLDRMVATARPDLLIVAVLSQANGPVGREVARYGLPLLLETPIAADPADADAIVAACAAAKAPVEVAEQYYRRPMERIKAEIIRAGLLGQINVAYSDFMGHAYHGISLVRSYVGFDVPIARVSAVRPTPYPVQRHPQSMPGPEADQEQWEHGVMQFANGALGIFDWTSIGYGSALRWQRSTRIFGSKGMAFGDEVTVLSPGGRHREPIRLERRIHNVGGMEALAEIVAHADPPLYWRNPFARCHMDDEMIAVAACLMSLVEAVRTARPPEYGPLNARTDQEVYLAMRRSAEQAGAPVTLPLRS